MRTAMFLGLIAFAVCLTPLALHAQGPFSFHEATRESGIDFRHTDGSSGRRYLVESFSGGVALLDYDQDGLLDIYFLNGAPLPGAPADPAARNVLYRNGGGWRFANVSGLAAVDDSGFGLGVCAADYNNDGFVDLYLTNFGPNVLYQNNGDGTFSNVTAQAGVNVPQHVGAGTAFLDIDNDGLLDLYVANYVEFSLDSYEPYVLRACRLIPARFAIGLPPMSCFAISETARLPMSARNRALPGMRVTGWAWWPPTTTATVTRISSSPTTSWRTFCFATTALASSPK
jgi:hypothetical protein